MTFHEYGMSTKRNNCRLGHQKLVMCDTKHTNYSETGEILGSCWLIRLTSSSFEEGIFDYDKLRGSVWNLKCYWWQLEIATWLPKLHNVNISIYERYQRKSNDKGFDHSELEETVYRQMIQWSIPGIVMTQQMELPQSGSKFKRQMWGIWV